MPLPVSLFIMSCFRRDFRLNGFPVQYRFRQNESFSRVSDPCGAFAVKSVHIGQGKRFGAARIAGIHSQYFPVAFDVDSFRGVRTEIAVPVRDRNNGEDHVSAAFAVDLQLFRRARCEDRRFRQRFSFSSSATAFNSPGLYGTLLQT